MSAHSRRWHQALHDSQRILIRLPTRSQTKSIFCRCRRDPDRLFDTVRTVLRVVSLSGLWDTVGMTNQQKRPQALEDRKVQKLVERIAQKQALQAKAAETRLPASPPTT